MDKRAFLILSAAGVAAGLAPPAQAQAQTLKEQERIFERYSGHASVISAAVFSADQYQ